MFGLGMGEIFLIFCIALLIFGPRFFVSSFDSVRESFSGFSKGLKGDNERPALQEGEKE